MKYGRELGKRSVPEWKAHNLDYNDVKLLIKKATSAGSNERAKQQVLQTLTSEYEAINLFVKSKAGEIDRRIDDCEKIVDALAEQEQSALATGLGFSVNSKARQGKLYRLHQAITKLTQDIQSLSRFIGAQQTGFRKLIKKYYKWSKSKDDLAPFQRLLESPQSFAHLDFTANFLELSLLYDVLRNAKFTIVRRKDDLPNQSLCKFDCEVVTAVGDSSIFLVHPDNVTEVNVALLKELKLESASAVTLKRSTSSALHVGKMTSGPTSHESDPAADSTTAIYLDTPKLEYAQTGKEPPQIRQAKDSSYVLCSATGGLRHFALATLTPSQLEAIVSGKAQDVDFDSLDKAGKLAIGWVQRKQARVMSQASYYRRRFSYVNDNMEVEENSLRSVTMQPNIWATMDSEIKLSPAFRSSDSRKLPYSVLEIRWNGLPKPDWVKELEMSHLVHRMDKGFSLYTYSVAVFHKDHLQSLPSWLDLVEGNIDIRKAPRQLATKRSIGGANKVAFNDTSNHAAAARSGQTSYNSSILLNDPQPKVSHSDENTPLMLNRTASFYNPQHKQEVGADSQLSVRYWNEFDNPEEGEDGGFYVQADEDDGSGGFQMFSDAGVDRLVRVSDHLWFRLRRLFGMGHDAAYESLDEDDYDDDDDNDGSQSEQGSQYSPRIKARRYRSSSSNDDTDTGMGYVSLRDEAGFPGAAARRREQILMFLCSICLFLAAVIVTILLSVILLQDLSDASLLTYVFMVVGFLFAVVVGSVGVALFLMIETPSWWVQTLVFSTFFSIVCFGVGGIAWVMSPS